MLFILLLQQLVASSTHLFAKHVTLTVHPASVVFYRGFFSVLLYGAWMLVKRKMLKPIERIDFWMVVFLGLINIPMNQLMFIWGLRYTTAPHASLAYALSPAFVALISHWIYGEKLRPMKILGIVVAFLGVVIILSEHQLNFDSSQLFGNCIELGASASWSLYTVLGRRMALKYGAVYSTGLSMGIGFLIYIPLFALLPVEHVAPASLNMEQWGGLMYLGFVTSGAGFALWYYLLTKMETAKVAVFNNLQPVMTTLMAFVITGALPSALFIVGGLIVLSGVLITQRS